MLSTDVKKVRGVLPAAAELCLLPAVLLYMELIARCYFFDELLGKGFGTMTAAALFLGFALDAPLMLLSGRARRTALYVTAGLMGFLFSFYTVYYRYFHMVFSWRMAGQAMDAVQFWRDVLVMIGSVWYLIADYFLPLILLCTVGRRRPHDAKRRFATAAAGLALALLFYGLLQGAMLREQNAQVTDGAHAAYTYQQDSMAPLARYFGVANTCRVEWRKMLWGAPEQEWNYRDIKLPTVVSDTDTARQDYGEHCFDIDFDAASASTDNSTLRAMNRYYASVPPVRENQYTGMFEGKNLIFLTLEGFSYTVIDPDFTPTLYRMATQGFVFDEFYTSSWTGSTASGEYANLTGNVYATSDCLKKLASSENPFVLGKQFKARGYQTFAYHNNTYTYYDRQLSHPSLGYTYKAIGNGLMLPHHYWPRSDREMAEATADDYIGTGKPFHAYYMTVSGHTRYSTVGNTMSKLHYDELPEKYRDYPEEVKAYLACQYEVELMLRTLVQRLEAAGQLEDTVFAMAADHYPYGMSDESLAWLYGLDVAGIRQQLPLYRDSFLVWCASMKEPVVVSRPAGNVDILPTLLNLFGMDYDSRILTGKDILSEGDHYAVLSLGGQYSWISTQGSYVARSERFTPSAACTLSDDQYAAYVDGMNDRIKTEMYYSHQILNRNYYRYLLQWRRSPSTAETAADYEN